MNDSRIGRNDAEILERLLSPAEKCVPLLIPVELEVRVNQESRVRAVLIDLNRVIDDEIDRLKRVDLACVSAELRECVAHCREVNDCRNSGEILEKNACRSECDLLFDFSLDVPARKRLDVALFDEFAVFISKKVFEENLEAEGKGCCLAARWGVERVEAINRVRSPPGLERGPASEAIRVSHGVFLWNMPRRALACLL